MLQESFKAPGVPKSPSPKKLVDSHQLLPILLSKLGSDKAIEELEVLGKSPPLSYSTLSTSTSPQVKIISSPLLLAKVKSLYL